MRLSRQQPQRHLQPLQLQGWRVALPGVLLGRQRLHPREQAVW